MIANLSGAWKIGVTAVLSFACGSLIPAHRGRAPEVKAASPQVFQLMVYHTQPGQVPALASIFQSVSRLQAKHGLRAIGYWVPQDDSPAWKDTFVYLLAHTSQQDAEKNWDALHADPAFLPYRNAAVPLIHQVNGVFAVDEVFMQPTAFSPMQ